MGGREEELKLLVRYLVEEPYVYTKLLAVVNSTPDAELAFFCVRAIVVGCQSVAVGRRLDGKLAGAGYGRIELLGVNLVGAGLYL